MQTPAVNFVSLTDAVTVLAPVDPNLHAPFDLLLTFPHTKGFRHGYKLLDHSLLASP